MDTAVFGVHYTGANSGVVNLFSGSEFGPSSVFKRERIRTFGSDFGYSHVYTYLYRALVILIEAVRTEWGSWETQEKMHCAMICHTKIRGRIYETTIRRTYAYGEYKHYNDHSNIDICRSLFCRYVLWTLESLPINFGPDSDAEPELYNRPISLREFQLKIDKNLRNASPGPDNIHAIMLRNPHPNSLSYIPSIFNSILLQNTYPSSREPSIILPILQPSKDPSLPDLCRPISLTNVLSKLHISKNT